MSYLLNTCVLSETVSPRPDESVVRWLSDVPDNALYISVLYMGEPRKGIEAMMEGSRRKHLRLWLEHGLPQWFGSRILPSTAFWRLPLCIMACAS